jgi:hypothetical protein
MTLDSPRGGEDDELPSEKQKSSRARPQLMCEACGHTWSPRNTAGASRHCSKCNSKQIIEVSDDNAVPSPEIAPHMAEVVVGKISVPPLLKDDPDIRQKLKELELARLDKQIRDLNGSSLSEGMAERMVANNILLLDILRRSEVLEESEYDMLASLCPWCGARGEEGLVYDDADGRNGNRCASCGHFIRY